MKEIENDNNVVRKTPEEIKKGLERCKNGADCDDCIGAYHCQVEADALAYIEQLESQIPKWISVEERLPDIDAEVLIYTDEGLYDAAQYSGGERFWTLERNPDCWVTALGVTHWMPLPEPMKE